MAVTRQKAKGRKDAGNFAALPHRIMESSNYIRLSSHAIRLLMEILKQYNGHNNGDLCVTWKWMHDRGFRSPSTLDRSIKELAHYGLIMLTRQGGRHKPNLYALTWQAIDECKGKLEVSATRQPPGQWKEEKSDFKA